MNRTYFSKYRVLFIHIAIWSMLFLLPYFLTSTDENYKKPIGILWVHLFCYIIIFYTNYLYLVGAFIKKKTYLFIIINLFLIGIIIISKEYLITKFIDDHFGYLLKDISHRRRPNKKLFLYMDIIYLIVPILFAIAIRIIDKWVAAENERKTIENEQLKTELDHLKYQLQPHFFFNSLNNIYSLIDISPNQAKENIHALSKLMRYMLYESNTDKILLSKEINFIEQYIALMRVRFNDNIEILSDFPTKISNIEVPPFLFISLVENAFKHGISAVEKSTISFKIAIKDKKITFNSENRNIPKSKEVDKSKSGIGLKNLEKRLQLLFTNSHVFTTKVENGNFYTYLEINL